VIHRFGAALVDGLLARARAAAAAIRRRVRPVVDVALAAVDVAAVVYVMCGSFVRRHLLAEARRHLAQTLRGRPVPTTFSDADGKYAGFDLKTHQLPPGGTQYTNFSGWDIYRSEIPLLATLLPQQTSDMAQSLVNDAAQMGWLPKWPSGNTETGVMNGDAADPIIAEAYIFGARDFDTQAALKAMVKGATAVPDSDQLGQGWYEERP
jgi:putative alpha-1,2-mannosidase